MYFNVLLAYVHMHFMSSLSLSLSHTHTHTHTAYSILNKLKNLSSLVSICIGDLSAFTVIELIHNIDRIGFLCYWITTSLNQINYTLSTKMMFDFTVEIRITNFVCTSGETRGPCLSGNPSQSNGNSTEVS